MTEAAFSNVRERGAWAKSAGNAAIWALGQMPGGVGVGPLARLRTKLRDRGALKLIASSIEAAAQNAGMTVDELEDLAVPTGGLDADGTRRETFGEDGAATLTLDAKNAKTNLQWFGPDGKPRKAVPAAVKKNWPAEVKALKAAEEEIKQALTAQAARFDKFLLDEREWPLAVWQERYLSHPILGNLARRLIWVMDGTPSLPDDATKNCQNEPAPAPQPLPSSPAGGGERGPTRTGPGGSLRLWHPLGAPPDDVLRWRQTAGGAGHRPALQAGPPGGLPADRRRAPHPHLLQSVRRPHPQAAPVQQPVRLAGLEEQAAPDGGRRLPARHPRPAPAQPPGRVLGGGHRRRLRHGHQRRPGRTCASPPTRSASTAWTPRPTPPTPAAAAIGAQRAA